MRSIRYISVVSLFVIIATIFIFHSRPSAEQHNKKSPHTVSQKSASSSHSTTSGANTSQETPAPLVTQKTPTTDCDTVFSAAQAKQALGANAVADSGNGATSGDTDMTIKICGYHTSGSSAAVTVRIATTSAGVSKNIVFFGSGRPVDTTPIDDYGSAAFWQPDKHILNILSDNNWFAVICTKQGNSSLDSAKAVGKVLKL